ncbi:adenosine kinase-like [Homarus americanus]|uniref:adenosine kinase-like n=1 Tax=Homarus americanus TaxID=6706 RepID=UPI001C486849|nr:adenosine kinase-like [Homarus americanus]
MDGQNEVKPQPLLVAFGNPLLDITAVVKDRGLHDEFQLPVDGQLEITDQQRALFSLVMKKYPVEYTAGGCALNSSRVFCWVLGEPERVVFVGGIGKDEQANKLSAIIKDSGVVTRFVDVEDQPTGMCVALVLGACRCLCADIGAANVCEPHHVFNLNLFPVLEPAKFVYVEGYFITHSFRTTLQIAKYAQKKGKTFVFNLCGSYVCENHPNELAELLPYVDILFGFVEEYKTLDKFVDIQKVSSNLKNNPNNITHDILQVLRAIKGEEKIIKDNVKYVCEELREVAKLDSLKISDTGNHLHHKDRVDTNGTTTGLCNGMINGHGCDSLCPVNDRKQKLVVVTKGPNPLLYVHSHEVRERPVPPISPKDIVDTTGAGDSFVGGFLAALSTGQPLDKCLDCGTWTAQKLLQQKGCTLPTFPATFLSQD